MGLAGGRGHFARRSPDRAPAHVNDSRSRDHAGESVPKVYTTQLDAAAVYEEARFAVRWIERVLRSAGSNPYNVVVSQCPLPETTFKAIERDPNANDVMDDIRVHADVNPPNGWLGGEACGDDLDEDVTIAFDETARTITHLDHNGSGVAAPITDAVITLLEFAYFDDNRVVAASDDDISVVRVTVTSETTARDAYLGRPQSAMVSSEIRVRMR